MSNFGNNAADLPAMAGVILGLLKRPIRFEATHIYRSEQSEQGSVVICRNLALLILRAATPEARPRISVRLQRFSQIILDRARQFRCPSGPS